MTNQHSLLFGKKKFTVRFTNIVEALCAGGSFLEDMTNKE